MSYEKHTWQTGETITADKLNNIENGVASSGGSGITIFNSTYDDQTEKTTLSGTYEDVINSSFAILKELIYTDEDELAYTVSIQGLRSYYWSPDDGYHVLFGDAEFFASSPNDLMEYY